MVDDEDPAAYEDILIDDGARLRLDHHEDATETSSLLGGSHGEGDSGVVDDEDGGLGGKNINMRGSLVLCINNVVGPGMLALPLLFQKAGWLTPMVAVVLLTVVSSFCATLMCESMSMIPGNSRFTKRIEFANAVSFYFGTRWANVAQVSLNVCLQSLNIASIVVSAQSMDQLIILVFGKSVALRYAPSFAFVTDDVVENGVFEEEAWIITVGYVLTLLMCIPMGMVNLEENISFQYASFALLIGVLIEFLWQFTQKPLRMEQTPIVGVDNSQLLGVLMFSYAFVITIPSWVNEKKEEVSVNRAIWSSTAFSSSIYIFFGMLAAWAYPNMTDDDILGVMYRRHSPLITKYSVIAFSLGTLAPGIALFSIMIKYNLYVGKVCSMRWARFWGVVFPWCVSFLLYTGQRFAAMINYSSLLVVGFINYIVPLVMYLKACRMFPHHHDKRRTAVDALPTWLELDRAKFARTLIVVIVALLLLQVSMDVYFWIAERRAEQLS